MPCVCQPVLSCCGMASDLCAGEDTGGSLIAEALAQYRPRHPERTVFYQLFEDQFDSYVRAYEQRFEPRSGPLRPVVVRSVEEFLSCGRLEGGFARLRCPKCHAEHLLAFSCRPRGICSSCQAKRAALFAERLTDAILAPVPHRHWTFSIPRVLRGLVERDRKLLGLLSQAAYASLLKTFQALSDRKDVRPGCVIALQTFGAYAGNWNPHAHAIVSDGVFTAKGEFLPLPAPSRERSLPGPRSLRIPRAAPRPRILPVIILPVISSTPAPEFRFPSRPALARSVFRRATAGGHHAVRTRKRSQRIETVGKLPAEKRDFPPAGAAIRQLSRSLC
jgi:hypothetical protein